MTKAKKKLNVSLSVIIFIACLFSLAMMFYTVAFFLGIGMLPTIVVYMTSKKHLKIRALTIGALNFAGCFPYVADLLHYKNDLGKSLEILSDPMTIVVAYTAAAIGYMVDWSVSGIASTILYQQGEMRRKDIQKEQEALIERWGEKVKGNKDLDKDGFPFSDD